MLRLPEPNHDREMVTRDQQVAKVRTRSGLELSATVANLTSRTVFLGTPQVLAFRERVQVELLGLSLEGEVVLSATIPRGVVVALEPSAELKPFLEQQELKVRVVSPRKDGSEHFPRSERVRAAYAQRMAMEAAPSDGPREPSAVVSRQPLPPSPVPARPDLSRAVTRSLKGVSEPMVPLPTIEDPQAVSGPQRTESIEVDAAAIEGAVPVRSIDVAGLSLAAMKPAPSADLRALESALEKLETLEPAPTWPELPAVEGSFGSASVEHAAGPSFAQPEADEPSPWETGETVCPAKQEADGLPTLEADGVTVSFGSVEAYQAQLEAHLARGGLVVRAASLPIGTQRMLVLCVPGRRPHRVRARVIFHEPGRLGFMVDAFAQQRPQLLALGGP
jgi:hypothetical protein